MSFSLVLRSMEAELGLVAMAACDAVPDETQVTISARRASKRNGVVNSSADDISKPCKKTKCYY